MFLLSPQASSLLVFQTLACSDDSRAHSYTSQAGDRMLVSSDLFKSSPIAKGWEVSPDLFILSYAAVLKYLTHAKMQFLSFGMFCSWASQKNHLMPSRKSSTSWSILMTTIPTNTFKRLWSSFRSSTMLCITNQLVKKKTASQPKRENSYLQANTSIGVIDSIFPHCAWQPL